jgi:hypothetical protein
MGSQKFEIAIFGNQELSQKPGTFSKARNFFKSQELFGALGRTPLKNNICTCTEVYLHVCRIFTKMYCTK